MNERIGVHFSWVPKSCGGHPSEPWVGMRPTIRWQRHIQEWLERIRDAECERLDFDSSTGQGHAVMRMASEQPLPDELKKPGSLIELLDGLRVIAVGVVESAKP